MGASKREYDSVYFLKVLLYLVGSSVWVSHGSHRIIPAGLVVGLVAVQHERLQLDRKIEYAILLVGAVLGLMGAGINLLF